MAERSIVMRRAFRLFAGLVAAGSILGACGAEDDGLSSAPPAHPALACGDDGSGTGNYDLVGPGLATPEAALNDRLGYYQALYEGLIVGLPNDEAALQVDGSNVVVATATAAADGGFLVQEDYFCNSFQPQQGGTPATEPPATATNP